MKKFILLIVAVLTSSLNTFGLEDKWNVAKSTHFILYYKDVPADFVDEVLNRAEDYYGEITENLGFTRYNFWLWDKRASIFIYDDVDAYQADTGQPSWSSGCVSVRDKIIKTYPLARGFFDTLLPHELGHIIFRELVGFDNRNIPLWLDEGVASYQEKTKRFTAKSYIRKAISENRFIPLGELTNINLATEDKDTIDLFYFESVALVDYLIIQFGKICFVNFCRGLRDAKTLEKALSQSYPFSDLTELNAIWLRSLKNE